MFRVPVDLPLSCPHRVKDGGRGCVFCPEDGARARHLRSGLDIAGQVRAGVDYVHRRYGTNCGLIAYFQSFTNTNAPVETLRRYYDRTLNTAEFAMIIIATRPDCLPEPVLDYLAELAEKYELLVELGVQTSNDATLARINRGHNFQSVRNATAKLAEYGIASAAHVILGLPGESIRDFRETASAISALPFSAIKIHNLLVLRKTPLAATFAKHHSGPSADPDAFVSRGEDPGFELPHPSSPDIPLIMNEYEYAEALLDFVSRIPDEWPLMRLTTDAPPETVIAPKWWMTKGQFFEYFKKRMSKFSGPLPSNNSSSGMPEVITGDGSPTLYHPEYRQHFHSLAGAHSEAFKKFVEPSGIRGKLKSNETVRVLDIGFGLGENAFALIETAKLADSGGIEIISLEMDERAPKAALRLLTAATPTNRPKPFQEANVPRAEVLAELLSNGRCVGNHFDLSVLLGDARQTLDAVPEVIPQSPCGVGAETLDEERGDCPVLTQNWKKREGNYVPKGIDVVFLDPFSHEVNPELWTYDFIRRISAKLAPDGVIVTYSAAFPIRGAMIRCGLSVGETPAVGRKNGGTIASFDESAVTAPLNAKNIRIIKETTTGTSYRDPHLDWDRRKIRNYRARLVKTLASKGVPKWISIPHG
ncbi:MAG: TIGR01212 family radical SAM protein [Victivallales bacterium]|nr:TIGR01212 family radical SAM protein [Victivallales bacterium]